MDELLAQVEHKVSSLGGYIENSDISNGSYFMTKVRHLFQDNQYLTFFEFKGAKA